MIVRFATILVLLYACVCPRPAAGQTASPASPQAAAATRGTASSLEFSYAGPRLRAKPNQTLASPLLVRITGSRPGEADATIYRVDYIGAVAGPLDLRDLLEHEDGSPAADLPPLPVQIVSQLPPNHGTDVYGIPDPPFTLIGWYREFLVATAIIWVAVPVFVFARRALYG